MQLQIIGRLQFSQVWKDRTISCGSRLYAKSKELWIVYDYGIFICYCFEEKQLGINFGLNLVQGRTRIMLSAANYSQTDIKLFAMLGFLVSQKSRWRLYWELRQFGGQFNSIGAIAIVKFNSWYYYRISIRAGNCDNSSGSTHVYCRHANGKESCGDEISH